MRRRRGAICFFLEGKAAGGMEMAGVGAEQLAPRDGMAEGELMRANGALNLKTDAEFTGGNEGNRGRRISAAGGKVQ